MSITKVLEKIGLSGNEAKVYLCLVDYGPSAAGKISKETGIQRSSAYGAINLLIHRGLVSFHIMGKTRIFQATPPQRLLEYVKEQEEYVKDIIPELSNRHKHTKTSGNISMFKGRQGIVSVLKDILREGKDNDVFGSEGQLTNQMPDFVKQFVREQNRLGLKTRNLIGKGRKHFKSTGTE
ncbi:MAG: helix-turn-helix domain-containing protein, partial [Nanoarchaeota archaeon]